jgi:hypothetical protein
VAAQQLGEIPHRQVGAMRAQRVGLPHPVHPDDDGEPAGPAGLRPGQEHVGCRLARQVALLDDQPVDPGLEQRRDAGGLEHWAVFAREDTTARRSPASRAQLIDKFLPRSRGGWTARPTGLS